MQPNLKEIKEMIKNENLESLKKDNPVGHIRFETTNTNPSTYLGFGTWVLWGAGRVPVGVNAADTDFKTVEQTGGAKTHTHTNSNTGSTKLTVANIPSHSHSLKLANGTSLTGKKVAMFTNNETGHEASQTTGNYTYSAVSADTTSVGGNTGHTHTNSDTGSSSTLQPYITCYMWKRTA